MRGLTAVLVFSLVAFVEGDGVSVEDVLRAQQSAVQEYYVFSPRQATSVAVAEPPVVDGQLDDACWRGLEPVTDFVLTESGGSPSQKTEVFLCHSGGVLYAGFRCYEAVMEERPDPTTPDYEPGDWEQRTDTLELYFSVANNHTDYFRLVIGIDGKTKLFTGAGLRGEFPEDRMGKEYELFRGPSVACEVVDEEEAWTGEVAIPVSAFHLRGDLAGQVWGFDVVRVRVPAPAEVSAWCCDPGRPKVLPIEFGDLLFGERSIAVTKIDLGKPYWGENSARVTLVNRLHSERKLRLLSEIYMPVDEVVYDRYEGVTVLAGGRTEEVDLPYELSWRGKWPVYPEYCQRLSLRVEDAGTGESLYAASYPVAFDVGVKPSERYGQTPEAPNPAPDDPDFLTRKRDFIIGRIPEFRRLGTADGAESDFVLAALDGSVRFHLMEEGVLREMADWLTGLFDNDIDRMLGATFFVHQRPVTCHSGFLSRMGPMGPLSVVRRGGGLCDSRARSLAGILSQMTRQETGEPYRCQHLGLKGHVVCAVEAMPEPEGPADHWVLDPDVGVFYFTRDNTHFATLGELRRDRWLSYRMNFNNVRHSHELYFNTDHQFTYDWKHEPVWPPDAPAW